MKTKISKASVLFFLGCVSGSALVAYVTTPLSSSDQNPQVLTLLATIFSILSGALLVSNLSGAAPRFLPPGSWRAAEMARAQLQARVWKHYWRLTLYLFSLVLLVSTALTPEGTAQTVIDVSTRFLCSLALLYTLTLPKKWRSVSLEAIDSEIERRRRKAGILPRKRFPD